MTQMDNGARADSASALNRTPRSNRLHIAIFGRRNAGKSSLINAIARQDVALVSPVAGTTTDPVYKAMEVHDLGPVVLIDTPGLDDVGELGRARVARTERVLRQTDVAVIAIDGVAGPDETERAVAATLAAAKRPIIIVVTKADLADAVWTGAARADDVRARVLGPSGAGGTGAPDRADVPVLAVSAASGQGVPELIAAVATVGRSQVALADPPIVSDLLLPGDVVVMVTPIDAEAPAGRMILPQMQTLRDILDVHATAIVVQPQELGQTLAGLTAPPRLVITDSQAFQAVAAVTPADVPLTSFSILFARLKGDLDALLDGARAVDALRPGDPVLIAEACTHPPITEDIGRVKIPAWLQRKVGGPLDFSFAAGASFPADLARYKLVIHCGACMINRREMMARIADVQAAGVPMVNYGVLIAHLQGILARVTAPLA